MGRWRFSTKSILLLIMLIFIVTQLTRFENNLVVSYDGENITTDMGVEQVKFQYANVTFNQVSARFQKSMKGENGLKSIAISDSGNKIFSHNPSVLYLFGRDIFGTMVKGAYGAFKTTFGDWSMDVFPSHAVIVYHENLPQTFDIRATFIGRGDKALKLRGSRNVTFEIYDGLISNYFCISRGSTELSYCICPDGECILANYDHREPPFWNVKRILNQFAEILLVALFVILVVGLISNKQRERK